MYSYVKVGKSLFACFFESCIYLVFIFFTLPSQKEFQPFPRQDWLIPILKMMKLRLQEVK